MQGTVKYIKQLLMELTGETDENTIILGDLNAHWQLWIYHPNRKINKQILALNDTVDQMDIINIYRVFNPRTQNYKFSSAHRTFSRIDHMVGHKSSFNKFRKIEIIPHIHIFSLNANGRVSPATCFPTK